MRLSRPFIRLPWNFDVQRAVDEITDLDDAAWMSHPSRLKGNSAVALVSANGKDNDEFAGRMSETTHLAACPTIRELLASFDVVIGRSRLMKLEPGCEVATHVDFNYHWYSRIRIHIPLITNDDVTFYCGDEAVHMAAGESWIFDSWRRHRVVNDGNEARVHLVLDTSGSSAFWGAVRHMENIAPPNWDSACETAGLGANYATLRCEQFNHAAVMPPGEMLELSEDLIDDYSSNVDNDRATVDRYTQLLRDLCTDWRQVWLEYADSEDARAEYQALLDRTAAALDPDRRALLTNSNRIGVNPVIVQRILRAALGPLN